MAKTEKYNPNKVEQIEGYLLGNYDFRYNEVLNEAEFKPKSSNEYISISDRYLSDLRLELLRKGFTGFTRILDDLLKSNRFCKSYNPFEKYFNSLPVWDKDKDPDYLAQLCSFITVGGNGSPQENQEWFIGMLAKHLMRTVACALRMIDFNKQCFVLQGQQNDGKTMFIRYLCPPILKKEYFKENPPLDHKDSVMALSQNVIILLDELHDLNKADANKVKSLFSQGDTKVRQHYGIKDTMQSRYASFFGTINDSEFLNDVTGNVRWLIFPVIDINHDNGGKNGYMSIDIDCVWSQVVSMVKNGYEFKLNKAEIEQIETINKDYQKNTVEMDLIQQYFEPCKPENPNSYFLASTDILQVLQRLTANSFKINSVQIGRALTYFKYSRIKKRFGNNTIYGYVFLCENKEAVSYINENLQKYKKELTTLTT